MKYCATKTILLFFLIQVAILTLQAPSIFAQEFNRYQMMIENDKVLSAFDTQTIKVIKDPYCDENLIDVWIKTVEDSHQDYNLSHYYIRVKDHQFQLIASVDFDSKGEIQSSTDYNYTAERFTDIIPESLMEKWYLSITKYLDDKAKIKTNTHVKK